MVCAHVIVPPSLSPAIRRCCRAWTRLRRKGCTAQGEAGAEFGQLHDPIYILSTYNTDANVRLCVWGGGAHRGMCVEVWVCARGCVRVRGGVRVCGGVGVCAGCGLVCGGVGVHAGVCVRVRTCVSVCGCGWVCAGAHRCRCAGVRGCESVCVCECARVCVRVGVCTWAKPQARTFLQSRVTVVGFVNVDVRARVFDEMFVLYLTSVPLCPCDGDRVVRGPFIDTTRCCRRTVLHRQILPAMNCTEQIPAKCAKTRRGAPQGPKAFKSLRTE